jgi:hypothetical protein
MFSSTVLTLIIVPVFYVVLDDFAEAAKARLGRRRAHAALESAA